MQFTRLGRPWHLALSLTSLTSLAIAVPWLASSLWNPEAPPSSHGPMPHPKGHPPPAAPAPESEPESVESTEKDFPPDQIFAIALWRHPSPSDRILHAERCVWSDTRGITRWQFFLAFDPGPELHQWLMTNPFSLAPTESHTLDVPNLPDWFPIPTSGHRIQRSSSTNMTILTRLNDGIVFMTNHGSGFNPSAQPSPAPDSPRPH